jgi:hypothetical protein
LLAIEAPKAQEAVEKTGYFPKIRVFPKRLLQLRCHDSRAIAATPLTLQFPWISPHKRQDLRRNFFFHPGRAFALKKSVNQAKISMSILEVHTAQWAEYTT